MRGRRECDAFTCLSFFFLIMLIYIFTIKKSLNDRGINKSLPILLGRKTSLSNGWDSTLRVHGLLQAPWHVLVFEMLVICVKEFLNRNSGYSFDNKLTSWFMIFFFYFCGCLY